MMINRISITEQMISYQCIFFVLSVYYFIKDKENKSFYFIIGNLMNLFVNIIAKGIIKQPKINIDPNLFKVSLPNGNPILYQNGIPFDMFGMPSTNIQCITFAFIYLVFTNEDNTKYNYLYFLWTIMIFYQLYYFNFDSFLQISIAILIGIIMALITFYHSKNIIKGNCREKKDDNVSLHLNNI